MSEDFIRYYIGDISIYILRSVLQGCDRFSEWELIPNSEFNHENSYGYTIISDKNEQLLQGYIKHSPFIAETKRPDLSKASLI
ncbi:MAG: hypothetical protein PHQ86_03560 [Dehalococcoidales bacterium]|nr:hypothetical protein [Dehalococcoidales bacterium]